MKTGVIKNDVDYNKACKRLYDLDFKTGKRTKEEVKEMELLEAFIEHYQFHHAKFDLPDPIEAIKFAIEQRNLKQKEIAGFFGGETRASEVLHRKRPLSLETIILLHTYLGISLTSLINKKLNAGFKFSKKVRDAKAFSDPRLLQKFKRVSVYA